MSEILVCSGCGESVSETSEHNHIQLSAMQAHDRECVSHGVPCRHEGACYVEEGETK